MSDYQKLLRLLDPRLTDALEQEVSAITRAHFDLSAQESDADSISEAKLRRWIDARWAPLLQAKTEGDGAQLALGLTLHKYGWNLKEHLENAIAAAGRLETNLKAAVKILSSPAVKPKKRPALRGSATQFEVGNLISIRANSKFYFAYVHEISSDKGGDYPVLEFYAKTSLQPLSYAALKGDEAIGERLNDGKNHVRKIAFSGLNFVPDPASQITVMAKDFSQSKPDQTHLSPPIGLFALYRFDELLETIDTLFSAGD